MRNLSTWIHSILLVTTPTLLFPHEESLPQIKCEQQQNFPPFPQGVRTLGDIFALLDAVESGEVDEEWDEQSQKEVAYFLAYLARRGTFNEEERVALEEDIAELLAEYEDEDEEDEEYIASSNDLSYEYSFCSLE